MNRLLLIELKEISLPRLIQVLFLIRSRKCYRVLFCSPFYIAEYLQLSVASSRKGSRHPAPTTVTHNSVSLSRSSLLANCVLLCPTSSHWVLLCCSVEYVHMLVFLSLIWNTKMISRNCVSVSQIITCHEYRNRPNRCSLLHRHESGVAISEKRRLVF